MCLLQEHLINIKFPAEFLILSKNSRLYFFITSLNFSRKLNIFLHNLRALLHNLRAFRNIYTVKFYSNINHRITERM